MRSTANNKKHQTLGSGNHTRKVSKSLLQKFTVRSVLSFVIVFGTTNCGYNFGNEYFTTSQLAESFKPISELQGQFTNQSVDVLFVIDNSGSMNPAQVALAAEVDEFADTYLTTNADLCVNAIPSEAYRHTSFYAAGNISNTNTKAILNKRICTKDLNGNPNDLAAVKNDFRAAMQQGVNGSGHEKILLSAVAHTEFNEKDANSQFKMWRPKVTNPVNRIIVMITDEDDRQNEDIDLATNRPVTFSTGGPDQYVTNNNCPRNFGSLNYFLDSCQNSSIATLGAEKFISYYRNFFSALDGTPNSAAYDPKLSSIVVSIQTASTLQSLRTTGAYGNPPGNNMQAFPYYTHANEITRVSDLLGGPSAKVDIGVPDYSPVFNAIGNIILKFGEFLLEYEADTTQPYSAEIRHANGSYSPVDPSVYTIEGNRFFFTNLAFLNSLLPTDVLVVHYIPMCLQWNCS